MKVETKRPRGTLSTRPFMQELSDYCSRQAEKGFAYRFATFWAM
jgi:hypothetical protein